MYPRAYFKEMTALGTQTGRRPGDVDKPKKGPKLVGLGVEHLGDRGLDAFVGIRDHQLDAAQATAGKLAQKSRSECLGLGRAEIHAENLAPAIAVDADPDDHRN